MNKFSSLQAAAASLIALMFTASSEKNLDKEALFAQGVSLFVNTDAVETCGFERAVSVYAIGRYLEVALLSDRSLPEAKQTLPFQELLTAAQWRLAELSDEARGASAPGFLFFGRTCRRDDLDAVLAVQGFMQSASEDTNSEIRSLRAQVSRLQSTLEQRHREVDARNAARRKPATVG